MGFLKFLIVHNKISVLLYFTIFLIPYNKIERRERKEKDFVQRYTICKSCIAVNVCRVSYLNTINKFSIKISYFVP